MGLPEPINVIIAPEVCFRAVRFTYSNPCQAYIIATLLEHDLQTAVLDLFMEYGKAFDHTVIDLLKRERYRLELMVCFLYSIAFGYFL